MRNLWPIERAVVETALVEYPELAVVLSQQIARTQVVDFENTGAGFFSELTLTADAPLLSSSSPLDCAHGDLCDVDNAMGFLVFLRDGRLAVIEGYCLALRGTGEIDFSTIRFKLKSPTYSR